MCSTIFQTLLYNFNQLFNDYLLSITYIQSIWRWYFNEVFFLDSKWILRIEKYIYSRIVNLYLRSIDLQILYSVDN